jgi:hypothetical protein
MRYCHILIFLADKLQSDKENNNNENPNLERKRGNKYGNLYLLMPEYLLIDIISTTSSFYIRTN